MIEQHERKSDKPYKEAFVDFIKSRQWHWFITIPIGLCDDDDAVLNRLRAFEATLCGKYLLNRYNKLLDDSRFSMVVGFEGEAKCGTRHAHILVHIPSPMGKHISHCMLISLFPSEFHFLWNKYSTQRAFSPSFEVRSAPKGTEDQAAIKGGKAANPTLGFGQATVARSIYTVKDVRQHGVPWSRFEFVTPPKRGKFKNENLSVIHNRDRQRRSALGLL